MEMMAMTLSASTTMPMQMVGTISSEEKEKTFSGLMVGRQALPGCMEELVTIGLKGATITTCSSAAPIPQTVANRTLAMT